MIDDIKGATFYRYPGSLTTPPCAEGVKWHVAVAQTKISLAEQVVYNYVLGNVENFRPPQPLGSRTVSKFTAS
jgi:carbonic anhydrase